MRGNAGHVRYSYSSVVNTVVENIESAFPNSAPKRLRTLVIVAVLILLDKNALEDQQFYQLIVSMCV